MKGKSIIIYLCLVMLTMTACTERMEFCNCGDASMVVSVGTRSGTEMKEPDFEKQQLRLYVADRRQELGYETGIELYCPDEWRIDLTEADYALTDMAEQWYKMAFVCIPKSASFGFEDKYYDFNNQLVDYSNILKKPCQSATEDLAIYRKNYNLWLVNGETKSLNVELERISGQLIVDMGILEDQFEKIVSKVEVHLRNVPDKMYIHDQATGEIILHTSRLTQCTYEGAVDSEGHYIICANLLPMQLIGCQVTVTFTDNATQEFPLINNAENPSDALVKIKPNTRTTLYFNGMEKNEFEVRYAGFPDTEIGVSEDKWNGWQETDDFLVEYAIADAGIFVSRASGDSRIQSLTYLVYESSNGTDYTLLRSRDIPDIATATWPLTRETMTWGQREALKDTLLLEKHYKAVFVANANGQLSGVAPGNAYADARLSLPDNITDTNMFYLATQDISGSSAMHNTPTKCKVVLQRAITRTDFAVAERPNETNQESLVNTVLGGDYMKGKYNDAIAAILAELTSVQLSYLEAYSTFKTNLESGFATAVEPTVEEQLVADFSNNPLWNCYNTTEISVTYAQYANKMDFDRTPYTMTETKTVTASGEDYSVYSFGANTDNSQNRIESVTFGEVTISTEGIYTNQGTNEHYRVTCQPIASASGTYSDITVTITLDLWDLFVSPEYKNDDYMKALNEVLDNVEAYEVNLSYPDLSKQSAWSSTWNIEK